MTINILDANHFEIHGRTEKTAGEANAAGGGKSVTNRDAQFETQAPERLLNG